MKLREDELFYKGYGIHPSKCRAGLYQGPGGPVIIVTELDDNPGTSVTNAAETVAWEACKLFGADPEKVTFIEHYPSRGRYDESFDLVKFSKDSDSVPSYLSGCPFGRPNWVRLSREELVLLIGGQP